MLALKESLNAADELISLDLELPRWAEDLVSQGAYTLYGNAKKVYDRKEELRKLL